MVRPVMAKLLPQATLLPKKKSGSSLVEVVITVAALTVVELSVYPLFLRAIQKNPNWKFSGLGCLFTQQIGFMQTATRYGGCEPLSLFLSNRGTTFEMATGSRFRSRTSMREMAGQDGSRITGPGNLSFQPQGAGRGATTYVLASRSMPRLSRHIAIQPVTGRILTVYE